MKKEGSLRNILDAIPGYVSWVSKDLNYLGANKNLAKAYNIEPEDFVGKPVGFMSPQPEPLFKNLLRRLFESS